MTPLHELAIERFQAPAVLTALAISSRQLAELKGVASLIPDQTLLINTLALQEAKDSSAIENIVTTHDELFREAAFPDGASAAAKEVARYRQALQVGFDVVSKDELLTTAHILRIQRELEVNDAGFRRLPGTVLRDNAGAIVYTPPQDPAEIVALMADLERFINDDGLYPVDALIKMALIHHQFESIHPFYDGNGRTGRIVCVLYLVKQRLLGIPILYLSRYIVEHKAEYYRLLQQTRDNDAWEEWVLFMLRAVERTASQGVKTIHAITDAVTDVTQQISAKHKFFSQPLVDNLFAHPYTKIEFLQNTLGVSRLTATKYLEALVGDGILRKEKIGRSNYYINRRLFEILAGEGMGT